MSTLNLCKESPTASVSISRVKEPVFPLILKLPVPVELLKSDEGLGDALQYKVVPLATLVVLTVTVIEDPWLILVTEGTAVYVAGEILVSFILILLEVDTIAPVVLPNLILTVNDSVPSVVASSVGVIIKEPVEPLIVKLPLEVVKSEGLSVSQYKVVPSGTRVVVTVTVKLEPSSILLGDTETE
jgi:cellobiose-specific phosphotransferase system component IIC